MINSHKIEDLHPVVQDYCNKHIAACERRGIDVVVTSTLRDAEYQESLYAQGRTKPGSIVTNTKLIGAHGFGLAYDMVPDSIPNNGKDNPSWDTSNPSILNAFRIIAEEGRKLGAVCGVDWKSIVDRPHYEYTEGLTYSQLREGRRPSWWEVRVLDWKDILKKVASDPTAWEKAINTAVAAAKADGNLGDLEVMQYLPTLIEKIYNSRG